jgi:hypothetical protein
MPITEDFTNQAGAVTITVDGKKGDLLVGGSGQDGSLELRDKDGKLRAQVAATSDGGFLSLSTVEGAIRVFLDAAAKLSLGGNGADGSIHLRPPSASGLFIESWDTIRLDGGTGGVTLKADGKSTIHMSAPDANIYVGGNDKSGDIFVYPSSVKGADTTEGTKASIRLSGGTADILAGGQGQDGALILFDSSGNEAIRLRTGHGDNGIFVRDQGGKVVLNFAAEANMAGKPAGLWLGRAKADGGGPGLLVLRDASGNDSITVDGAQGDIALANADFAEEFEIEPTEEVELGTVMVLDKEGKLRPSKEAYDKKVAGVISGAGDCKPGIVLDKKRSQSNRRPVAVLGKVYCKADAGYSPIEVGDLLTTSPTHGHAMKASEPPRTFGAVIGKALSPLSSGHGLIQILVTLQ